MSTKIGREESATPYEGSALWTLEEISRLVAHSGNPADTLSNIVQLIPKQANPQITQITQKNAQAKRF